MTSSDARLMADEVPIVFSCAGEELIGILHATQQSSNRGMLIVVGGPQYRVGSHRQFLLLARKLAQHGMPVLRFDYRAMGDSEGEEITFEDVASDISSAIEVFFEKQPELEEVVLWGLCDAASAALMYAHRDQRVAGMVLLNPWVRTEASMARTYIKHYYLKRLFAAEFYKKIFTGRWDIKASFREFYCMLRRLRKRNKSDSTLASTEDLSLPDRMLKGYESYTGKLLFILSENDYVADEFRGLVSGSTAWQRLMGRDNASVVTINGANHTFSTQEWRRQVDEQTIRWLESW